MQLARRVSTAILAAALCAAAACGSDSPAAPTSTNVVGGWNLRTVNGTGLPYTVNQTATSKHELTALTFTATGDGKFTESDSYRDTNNGVVTLSSSNDSGTWTINGNAITFTFASDGLSDTATISGDVMTINDAGVVLVFDRLQVAVGT